MFQKAEIANGNTFPSILNAEFLQVMSVKFLMSLDFLTFTRPINKNILLEKIKSDFQTQQVFCGGTMGGTKIKYVHIIVKIPPVWYFLQAVRSPMWDSQYYLQILWYSDDLNPTLVVTTVVLPPFFG